MQKTFLKLLFVAFAINLASCSPLNKKYSDEHFDTDLKEMAQSKRVDSTDLVSIGMYIFRAKLIGEKLEGKTYNDILKEAKDMRAEFEKQKAVKEALANKAAQEAEAKRQSFAEILTVELYDKSYNKEGYEDYIEFDVAFYNKSGKDIRAVKGSLTITDLFDTELITESLVMDEALPAGKIVKQGFTLNYNPYIDSHVRVRNKDLKDLKTVWNVEKIIFEDGTTMEQ